MDHQTIQAEIIVGSGPHCPHGNICPGQNWEKKSFCAIFGEELERDRSAPGRKHIYRKCPQCVEALEREMQEGVAGPQAPGKAHEKRFQNSKNLDIVRDPPG